MWIVIAAIVGLTVGFALGIMFEGWCQMQLLSDRHVETQKRVEARFKQAGKINRA
jgi:hypothetical protein